MPPPQVAYMTRGCHMTVPEVAYMPRVSYREEGNCVCATQSSESCIGQSARARGWRARGGPCVHW